jgi:hypothetical protein
VGYVLNDEVIDLTDFAIAGYTTISLVGGDVSLTANDGAADTARSAMLELTGTLTGDTGVYLPSGITKSYIVKNNTSGSFNATILIDGGTGTAVPQGGSIIVMTDGTTVTDAVDTTALGSWNCIYAELWNIRQRTYSGVVCRCLVMLQCLRTQQLPVPRRLHQLRLFRQSQLLHLHVVGTGAQAYSSPVSVAVVTSAVSLDFATGNNFTTILNGNVSIANPVNPQPGQSGIIYVLQDGAGSRTMSFNANWKFEGGTAPTLSTAADARDALIYNVVSATDISTFPVLNIS